MSVDFQLSGIGSAISGITRMGQGITDENICCAYGKDGLNMDGFDCLIFPNIVTDLDASMRLLGLEQCGRSNGLVNMGQKTTSATLTTVGDMNLNRTLCSRRTPFSIRFVSDNFEFADEANKAGMMRGFELQYFLQNC